MRVFYCCVALNEMFSSKYLPSPEHPQSRLYWFYALAYVLLGLEALNAVYWIVEMSVLMALQTGGASYRLVNSLMLFHLGIPVALQTVVTQMRNNNGVLWWTFFSFFVGFGSDLQTVLELFIHADRTTVPGAWMTLVVHSCVNMTLTTCAILLYSYWFVPQRSGIPQAVAFSGKRSYEKVNPRTTVQQPLLKRY